MLNEKVGEIVSICMSVLMFIKINFSIALVTAETLDEFSVHEDLMIIVKGIILVILLHNCKKC